VANGHYSCVSLGGMSELGLNFNDNRKGKVFNSDLRPPDFPDLLQSPLAEFSRIFFLFFKSKCAIFFLRLWKDTVCVCAPMAASDRVRLQYGACGIV
jgi:hypothetical protein